MTELSETTDAQIWAQEWCRIAREIENDDRSVIDEGWMIGWFANAIETGRSAGRHTHDWSKWRKVYDVHFVDRIEYQERICETCDLTERI